VGRRKKLYGGKIFGQVRVKGDETFEIVI